MIASIRIARNSHRDKGKLVVLCKNVFEEYDAVSEMKLGPLKPDYRNWFQTAVSCFRPKACGGERYGLKPRMISECMAGLLAREWWKYIASILTTMEELIGGVEVIMKTKK